MSELDLIKKLERLSAEKPNKDWVSFTRESILSSSPEIQKNSFERLIESLDVRSLAPMMICIFAGLIFGGVTTLFTPETENNLMTAVIEEGEANVSEIASTLIEEEPVVATPLKIEDDVLLDEQTLATMLNSENKETTLKEIESRIGQIKSEVIDCKRLGEFLTGTDKERCDELEDQYNKLEQILGEEE
jgi:hypothetical protein